MKKCGCFVPTRKAVIHLSYLCLSLLSAVSLFAQDGTAGINDANTKVRSYFSAGTNLMYAIGAIVGLIGAIKVFNKSVSGRS